VIGSGIGPDRVRGYPTIRARIVSATGIQIVIATIKKMPTPDNHFTTRPHYGVTVSCIGRVGGAGGCPTIRVGIVSPARVKSDRVKATPDDHFTAGPDCRVTASYWQADFFCIAGG
jgi:hypothetical protein